MLADFIKEVNSRPSNDNLHYYVCEWNDSYIIQTNQYIEKWGIKDWIYSARFGQNVDLASKEKFKFKITKNG